jgi:hypothetical protein
MSIRLLIKESHKLKRKMRKKAVETINQDYFCSDQKCTCCNRLEVWQLENASSISADIDSVSIDIDDDVHNAFKNDQQTGFSSIKVSLQDHSIEIETRNVNGRQRRYLYNIMKMNKNKIICY